MVGAPRDKYRVGAIGCGPKGTSQARTFALHPLTEVVSAADTDPDNLEIFCGRFDVPGYGSHLEMLDREAIDIAMPVLSVRPNARVVIDCARAGVKAILCEKPICASLEDADRMVEECRSRGIPFAAGDMVRNLPLVWKAKELLDSGELGEVQGMNLYYPKASSTEMWGGGCQALSVMRLFAGDVDVEWVVGWVKGDPWSDDDQGMAGHVRFANGIECTIHSKEAVKKGIEVLCTRGAFFMDILPSSGAERRAFQVWKLSDGADIGTSMAWDLDDLGDPFDERETSRTTYDSDGWTVPSTRTVATAQSIIDSLEHGKEPRTSGDDLRKALEIAIALRESHRRGHAAVKLPIEDRSLKIVPHSGRWLNKKETTDHVRYAAQLANYTKS